MQLAHSILTELLNLGFLPPLIAVVLRLLHQFVWFQCSRVHRINDGGFQLPFLLVVLQLELHLRVFVQHISE